MVVVLILSAATATCIKASGHLIVSDKCKLNNAELQLKKTQNETINPLHHYASD